MGLALCSSLSTFPYNMPLNSHDCREVRELRVTGGGARAQTQSSHLGHPFPASQDDQGAWAIRPQASFCPADADQVLCARHGAVCWASEQCLKSTTYYQSVRPLQKHQCQDRRWLRRHEIASSGMDGQWWDSVM